MGSHKGVIVSLAAWSHWGERRRLEAVPPPKEAGMTFGISHVAQLGYSFICFPISVNLGGIDDGRSNATSFTVCVSSQESMLQVDSLFFWLFHPRPYRYGVSQAAVNGGQPAFLC